MAIKYEGKKYVAGAFSIQMLASGDELVSFTKINSSDAREYLVDDEFESAIGHIDTANIVGSIIGLPIPANRQSIKIKNGDLLIVAQYTGPRLPEGATQLPEGARIEFWKVEIL